MRCPPTSRHKRSTGSSGPRSWRGAAAFAHVPGESGSGRREATLTKTIEEKDTWPDVGLEDWRETYTTLHLWTQLLGKTRLALSPPQNHWWHTALYVTTRGLTTSPIPYADRTFEVELDFVEQMLVARVSDGATRSFPLAAQSVADFYRAYLTLLRSLDINVTMRPVPSEVADPIPFPEDRIHATYHPNAALRCWRLMVRADRVMKAFRGRFIGKCSPVHFWWGGFDIACTRFSGRPAPPHPGGVPNIPDYVNREAYSHECISAGWWPGAKGGPVDTPVFYAYAYPEPPGCPEARVRPRGAQYHPVMREWILAYNVVRKAPDPDAALTEFLESTYEAAAGLAGWDRAALERPKAVRALDDATSVFPGRAGSARAE
jgi:uncharacterized protein DUF5996